MYVRPSVRPRPFLRFSPSPQRRSPPSPPLLFRKGTRSIHPSIPGGTKSREEGRKKERRGSERPESSRATSFTSRTRGGLQAFPRQAGPSWLLPSFRPRNEHFSTRGAEEKEGLAQYGQCTPREVHAAWTSLNSTLVGSKYPDKSALSRLLIGCMRSGGRGWRTGQ